MILIFLKIFVEGFLGNLLLSEQVLAMEIQFCFKVRSSSLIVLKSAVESLLSHWSFHSPAPHLSIPQLSFQQQHQWHVCSLAPLLFFAGVVHSPKAAMTPFQFVVGIVSCEGKRGAMSLLSDK